MGDRERAGPQVLLLGRGIGVDWTKIENQRKVNKHCPKRRLARDELAVPCACFILVVRERRWSVTRWLGNIRVPVDESVRLSRRLRRVSLVLSQVLVIGSSILERPSPLWLRGYQSAVRSLRIGRCDRMLRGGLGNGILCVWLRGCSIRGD